MVICGCMRSYMTMYAICNRLFVLIKGPVIIENKKSENDCLVRKTVHINETFQKGNVLINPPH